MRLLAAELGQRQVGMLKGQQAAHLRSQQAHHLHLLLILRVLLAGLHHRQHAGHATAPGSGNRHD
jgi:hypothetical protein